MAETKKKQQREFTLALPVGTILRNGQYQYRIEETLGQGNYGITYKASAMVKIGNISKPMTFAIKENFAKQYCSRKADGVTMSYSSVHAEEAKRDLKDFVAEGKTLAQICNGHKNIVNVNETFEENNTAYYVMEFIEGGNLCDLVKSKGRLTENEAIQILVPIVDAVSHMHKNRRLHLDIKPENIMLKKDGTPILIDFGITLHFNANGGLTGTSKDKSGGLSNGYAPLEQYAGVNRFAPEIDVYALGATLYYMLSGKEPEKAADINSRKIDANLPNSISQQTRAAITHAMEKLKETRTHSITEFISELGIKAESGTTKRKPYASTDNKTAKAAPMLTPYVAIKLVFSRLLDFKGRSRRSEFWWAALLIIPIWLLLFRLYYDIPLRLMDYCLNNSSYTWDEIHIIWNIGILTLWALATFLMTGVEIRRLHDVGHTAWWVLSQYIFSLYEFDVINFRDYNINSVFAWVSLLLILVTLLFCTQDSRKNGNKYGESPKYKQLVRHNTVNEESFYVNNKTKKMNQLT